MLKRVCPPPAPRSLAANSGRLIASATKLVSSRRPFCSPLLAKYSGLAGEALLEVVIAVEDEVEVAERVDDHRRIGHRDVARRLRARAVEVLVPAVERDGEDRARLPLEAHAVAGVVPDRGRAAPVEHVDHLLEELALRREALAGRDLADVAVVRGARGVVVEEHALAAAPRPGLELDGVQVLDVEGADDVQPLVAHPAGVGRLLLGRELFRELLRDGRRFHSWL